VYEERVRDLRAVSNNMGKVGVTMSHESVMRTIGRQILKRMGSVRVDDRIRETHWDHGRNQP